MEKKSKMKKVFTQIKTSIGAICFTGAVAAPQAIPFVPPEYLWAVPAGQAALSLIGTICVGKSVWNAWKEDANE